MDDSSITIQDFSAQSVCVVMNIFGYFGEDGQENTGPEMLALIWLFSLTLVRALKFTGLGMLARVRFFSPMLVRAREVNRR